MIPQVPLAVAPQVRDALERGTPVVALESTVIAHGLPHPRNLEVALELEAVVEAEGACPATIGVVAGRPTVGLTRDEIERFATGSTVLKASGRDLGAAVASGGDAATTVAATSMLARLAGIRVIATGGIGGVHHRGQDSLDVSADLGALAKNPVAVVCAGAKAILDLNRTLEVLETLGVPVIGLGTSEFPAFYSRSSGLRLEHEVADPREAAGLLRAHWGLGLESGVLVCNPPPLESEIPAPEVAGWIERAQAEAETEGVSGKDVTPWLLDRLARLSGGRTVEANVALLESNARAAARIARALAASS